MIPGLPCFLLLLPFLNHISTIENDTVILTSSGPIRGTRLSAGSGTVTAFMGIPYAQPPVGELRFRKPLPLQPWNHVLEATKFGNSCHQTVMSGFPDSATWAPNTPLSENCLFLNVWVPHPRPLEPIPVLVWIYGGGFFSGTASLDINNGRFFAATENVIVASMNYRLGALGFLLLPPDAPGNVGLFDQRLAMQWLKENAAAFGGDPSRLMIFGESAGGASVGYHLLSPGSWPFFARATLQSGVANAPWAWIEPEEAKERGQTLAKRLGCAEGNDSAMVSCLRGKAARELVKHEFAVVTHKTLLDLPFLPTTDGDFISDEPRKLLETMEAKPVLAGTTANEGTALLLFSLFLLKGPPVVTFNYSLMNRDQLLQDLGPETLENTLQVLAQRYSQEGKGLRRYWWALDQAITDYYFMCPTVELAQRIAEAGSAVYAYSFTHASSVSIWPEWMGVPHGAEVPYLFGRLGTRPGDNQTYLETDAVLSRRVMRYWADFARSGNPNGADGSGEQWPRYTATEKNLFLLGTEPPQVMEPSSVRRCHFLTDELLDMPRPTPANVSRGEV